MTRIVLVVFWIVTSMTIHAQVSIIYSKAYGQSENPVIIFIHGGPSGNATLFEGTTAQELAENRFYVIVYDRRGEGRSIDTTATFTYQEAINDLNDIYKTYHIEKANLIAHSFGGLVATLFTQENPEKVNSLILAGALYSQQKTYNHILKTTERIYKDKNDILMLSEVVKTEKLSRNSAEYRKHCFELASLNNYFKMPIATKESDKLRANYELSEFGKQNIRNSHAPLLFYKNETKNNIDTEPILKEISRGKVKLFAIYGQQDKIFSTDQLKEIKKIVKEQNFKIIDNCSHYLFVDQQQTFIETVVNWIK